MSINTFVKIERILNLSDHEVQEKLTDFVEQLAAAGISAGFTLPFNRVLAAGYWRDVAAAVARETRMLFLARSSKGDIKGFALLAFCRRQNAWHRARIENLLVAPCDQDREAALGLLHELEAIAHAFGIRLLTAEVCKSAPEDAYVSSGYSFSGSIPDFQRAANREFERVAIYFKVLQ